MTQDRFSNLTIHNNHKQRTDKLCLLDVANEFVGRNERRKRNFGIIKETDIKSLKLSYVIILSRCFHQLLL